MHSKPPYYFQSDDSNHYDTKFKPVGTTTGILTAVSSDNPLQKLVDYDLDGVPCKTI